MQQGQKHSEMLQSNFCKNKMKRTYSSEFQPYTIGAAQISENLVHIAEIQSFKALQSHIFRQGESSDRKKNK